MKSIKERNEDVMVRMRERFDEKLKASVEMSLSELIEYTRAVAEFTSHREPEADSILAFFMLEKVDWSDAGEPENIIPRYKTFDKHENAIKIAVRDWDNRYEMGNK